MTDIFKTPAKAVTRNHLFKAAVTTLEKNGWTVERIRGAGKSSVRRITKNGKSRVATIRTTQDTWIAFPRNLDDTAWSTLEDADVVIASSVDDKETPRFARVHMIEADEMRARFDRHYAARKAANHSITLGRGIWLSLYEKESKDPVSLVGAGAGLDNPEIGRIPLDRIETGGPEAEADEVIADDQQEEGPLTIAEAKRRLALTFGVDPSAIKITVEG
ncbi:hypothetical protein [Mesorhizobium sp. A556]